MKNTEYSISDLTVILLLAAVLGPAFIQQSVPSWVIMSMTWEIIVGPTLIPLFNLLLLVTILPFTFMRLIVIFMFYRLYQNKTTFKRLLVSVLLCETQPLLVYDIPLFLAALQGLFPYYIPFIIPIPFLALMTLLLVRIYPPPIKEDDWLEESQ